MALKYDQTRFAMCFRLYKRFLTIRNVSGKGFAIRKCGFGRTMKRPRNKKIFSATRNGQLELVDCGCGESYRLIVSGGAKGEVWHVAENGIIPYGDGMDFLDWMNDFLDRLLK